jgi:hypothetical protein
VDSEEVAAAVESEIFNENRVAPDLEIITETPPNGDAWIRESTQPLLIQKLSTKTKPLPNQK